MLERKHSDESTSEKIPCSSSQRLLGEPFDEEGHTVTLTRELLEASWVLITSTGVIWTYVTLEDGRFLRVYARTTDEPLSSPSAE